MVRSGEIDQVFVTFPFQEAARLADVQDWLGDEPVTLFYVPDLGEFAKLRGRIEEFEDLQIVTLAGIAARRLEHHPETSGGPAIWSALH